MMFDDMYFVMAVMIELVVFVTVMVDIENVLSVDVDYVLSVYSMSLISEFAFSRKDLMR